MAEPIKATFKKATKEKSKLRLALTGVSGAGKTFSALSIGSGLGSKMALIDTEHGSAALYADYFNFDVIELDSFSVEKYSEAINEAIKAKYDVLVIDSLSHAWMGKDGIIEFKDKKAAASQSGNSFDAWRYATPLHTRFIEAILSAPLHVIATMRSEMDYSAEKDDRGKTVIRKLGLAPVQRKGMEYEFSMVGDMNLEHQMVVTKSRIGFADEVISKPGKEFGEKLKAWLESGAEATPKPAPALEDPLPSAADIVVARKHVVKTKAYPQGVALGDLSMEMLNKIIESDKASAELRDMAYKVLEDKECMGEGIPDEPLQQEQLGV